MSLKTFRAKTTPKKRMIIVIISVVAVIVLMFGISLFIDYYNRIQDNGNADVDIEFNFYDADYDEDIFEDEEYLDLIKHGFINYTDGASNITIGIEKDTAHLYGDDVEFVVDYLYSIINGDAQGYGMYFDDEYKSKIELPIEFTMQKIYDVNILKISETDISGEGELYTEYKFALEYKILKNNGTFRKDIGDGSKKQYFTISDRSGELLIENISTSKFKLN